MREQKSLRIVHLALCRRKLQITIERITVLLSFGKRQGRFTRLPRPKENDGREPGEQATELLLGNSWIHPCNTSFEWKNRTVRVS